MGGDNTEDEDETQTNTGRFHKFADFDHDGMDDKQFREKLKEKMGAMRDKSIGNRNVDGYMAHLAGGGQDDAPKERRPVDYGRGYDPKNRGYSAPSTDGSRGSGERF